MKKIYFVITLVILMSVINDLSAQKWLKVSCGAEFSMGLMSDSTLWAWGFNGNGQLGIGNTTTQLSPVKVGTDHDWKEIATGSVFCLAIKNNGTLWAWGLNSNSELGDGTTNQMEEPEQIGTDDNWKTIAAGFAHSIAIKSDGSLWAWGSNAVSQIGDSTLTDRNIPVKIHNDTGWVKVAAGGYHSVAIKSNGTLWAWGYNNTGQIGDSTAIDSLLPCKPKQIGNDTDWLDISAGFQYNLGIKKNGTIWSWGFNGNGQLGDSTLTEHDYPKQIGKDNDWNKIAAGATFAFAIKSDSTLYGWGFNGSGQLGDGTTQEQDSPEKIGFDNDWVSITGAVGLYYSSFVIGGHSLGLKSTGNGICASGANEGGQLGDSTTDAKVEFDCSIGTYEDIHEVKADNAFCLSVYPNPANERLAISYQLSAKTFVSLGVYDVLGNKVETFVDKIQAKGDYKINLNLSSLKNGVYLVKLSTEKGTRVSKFVKQ